MARLVPVSRHRVLCGDSTRKEDVAVLLGEDRPHLMVTDPPYGVEYDPAWRNRAIKRSSSGKRVVVGGRALGRPKNDQKRLTGGDQHDWTEAWRLFPGDVAYIWHSDTSPRCQAVYAILQDLGWDIRAQIIWVKSSLVISRGHYHPQHEPCWYAVRKGKKAHWTGSRQEGTAWFIPKPQKSETGHSTQKPVECMRRPIVNNSRGGDLVYDPFLGSGTTVVAAEMTGRRCLGVELDLAYVDVSVRRWEKFSGGEARLGGPDGPTFEEVAAERLGGGA